MRIRHALVATGLVLAACALLFARHANAQEAPAPPSTLSLADALAAARDNLDVRLAGRAAAAAQADIAAADHAPLPQLSAKLSQIDLQNGIGPGNAWSAKRIDKGVGVDWTWERGDKRALRTEAARRAAGAAVADVDTLRLQQQLAAHAAFFDLLAAQGRAEALAAIARGAGETAAVLAARQRSGDIALQDAARAEIEAARAKTDAETAGLDVQRAQLALAALLGRPAAGLVARADWPALPGAPTAVDETLIDRRADLRAAGERVHAAQAAADGASALRKTDVTWGASLDHIPGTSTRQLELRLSLPLAFGYRYEGETGRAQAQLAQAHDALEKTRLSARLDLQRLQAELAAAALRWQRHETEITPRAREVAERAELAYRKGALPLTDLLDARRTLRAVLLDALAARTELAKASGAWALQTAAEQP